MDENLQALEKELRLRGWHIKAQALLDLIKDSTPSSLADPGSCDALEAELLDYDLKNVGSPCLPDALSLKRMSRIQGPLVLQVVSIRNVCQSTSKFLKQTGPEHLSGRLLRIQLTDGCNMISVIEYHPMPAFSVNIAPGTKVKLENSVSIHSGFLLGDANSFKILGGHVSALYESWEMECKYSGLARMATAKAARIEDDSGPPPFRGLHATRKGNHSSEKKAQAFSKDANDLVKKESVERRSSEALIKSGSQIIHQSSIASSSNQAATSSDPKESGTVNIKDGDIRKDAIEAAMALGVDMAPLQNRAAAQRLLERRTDSNTRTERGRSRGRGRGRRGARHDEEATLTLDEWEAKKALSLGTKAAVVYQGDMDTCNDEVLAQQLHYQLNMDNSKTSNIPGASKEAEQIRLSMFNFANASDDTGHGGHGGRRRGRGHGRRRGRY